MEQGLSKSGSDMADWKPGPAGRIFGWLLIAASPVFCAPFVALYRDWDRLEAANSPLWVLPLVLLGYLGLTAALLSVGTGVLKGRDTLIWNGTGLFFGMFLLLLTLFAIFD